MLTFRKGMDKLAWCRSIAFFKFPVEVGKAAEPGSHGGNAGVPGGLLRRGRRCGSADGGVRHVAGGHLLGRPRSGVRQAPDLEGFAACRRRGLLWAGRIHAGAEGVSRRKNEA